MGLAITPQTGAHRFCQVANWARRASDVGGASSCDACRPPPIAGRHCICAKWPIRRGKPATSAVSAAVTPIGRAAASGCVHRHCEMRQVANFASGRHSTSVAGDRARRRCLDLVRLWSNRGGSWPFRKVFVIRRGSEMTGTSKKPPIYGYFLGSFDR